jgi:adenylate cyclase
VIKILVVDDESDIEFLILKKFKKQIQAGNFQFYFASDGLEAQKSLKCHPGIGIVLLDIKMPRMDGFELLAFLKEHYPLLCTIMITAYSDLPNIRAAMNQGAYDFLTKPFVFNDLEATLHKEIGHVTERLRNFTLLEQARCNLEAGAKQYRHLVEKVADGIAIVQMDDDCVWRVSDVGSKPLIISWVLLAWLGNIFFV